MLLVNNDIISQAAAWLTQHIASTAIIVMPDVEMNKLVVMTDCTIPDNLMGLSPDGYLIITKAGLGTNTLTANTMHYRALATSNQVLGVLAMMPTDSESFDKPNNKEPLIWPLPK